MFSNQQILSQDKYCLIKQYLEEQNNSFFSRIFKPKKLYPADEFIKLNDSCKYFVTQAENDPKKQFLIGCYLIEGNNNFPKKIDLGIKYLEKSIQGKYIESALYLSNMLLKGDIIPKDLKKAKKYLSNHLQSKDCRIFSLYASVLSEEKNYKESPKYLDMCSNPSDLKIPIMVIGGSAVGKTSICRRFVNNCFSSETHATIGIDYFSKFVCIHGHNVKLQIWDTSGPEKLHSVTRAYYRMAKCAIVVMDFNQTRNSLESIRYFKELINDMGPMPVAIVRNKIDLTDEGNEYLTKELEELKREYDFKYFEFSAKTNTNADINEIFQYVATEAFDKYFYILKND